MPPNSEGNTKRNENQASFHMGNQSTVDESQRDSVATSFSQICVAFQQSRQSVSEKVVAANFSFAIPI